MGVPVDSGEEVVRSNCRGCHGGCGVLVHVKDSTIVRIEGDPDFPTNRGTLCSRGLAFKQLVYHPDRLKYPLKRAGKKGEGKWEHISWEEALDTIVSKLKQVKTEYGAESIVLAQGTSFGSGTRTSCRRLRPRPNCLPDSGCGCGEGECRRHQGGPAVR